jgi:truncated hemoglobin YjbI
MSEILRKCLAHEHGAQALYRKLLAQTEGRSIMIEEYARTQIATRRAAFGRDREDASAAWLNCMIDTLDETVPWWYRH